MVLMHPPTSASDTNFLNSLNILSRKMLMLLSKFMQTLGAGLTESSVFIHGEMYMGGADGPLLTSPSSHTAVLNESN